MDLVYDVLVGGLLLTVLLVFAGMIWAGRGH
jgi:hypothetical protein